MGLSPSCCVLSDRDSLRLLICPFIAGSPWFLCNLLFPLPLALKTSVCWPPFVRSVVMGQDGLCCSFHYLYCNAAVALSFLCLEVSVIRTGIVQKIKKFWWPFREGEIPWSPDPVNTGKICFQFTVSVLLIDCFHIPQSGSSSV